MAQAPTTLPALQVQAITLEIAGRVTYTPYIQFEKNVFDWEPVPYYGKKGKISYRYQYVPEWVPDEWTLTISSCNPLTPSQQNCQTNTIYVSSFTYDRAQYGQYIDLSNNQY